MKQDSPVRVVFTEAVTVGGTPRLTLNVGTPYSVDYSSGSGTDSLIFGYTVAAGQGPVTVNIPAGSATDDAGNENSASDTLSRTYDSIGPTVSLSTEATEPTNASPFVVTVEFSESVNGFSDTDIGIGNGSISDFSGSGSSYTFNVSPAGQGPVTVNVPAGSATDDAGNENSASATLSRTYDSVVSTVSLSSEATEPINASPFAVTVEFSESVNGFSDTDIGIGNGSVSDFSGSGSSYTFDVSPAAQGAVTVSVPADVATDSAGNGNTESEELSRTYDGDAPTATINQAFGQKDPTNAVPIVFTVTFSEPVSGFDAADVDLSGSTAPGTLEVAISGSDDAYTVEVSGMTGKGVVAATVPAGAAQDAAGNDSIAGTASDNSVYYYSFLGLNDVISILQIATNTAPAEPVDKEFDVNKDGKIGTEEAVYSLRIISGK